MNLKDFVKNVLVDLNDAVDEARGKPLNRNVQFSQNEQRRTIEFDIAVTAEERGSKQGGGGVRVLQLADIGGKTSKTKTNTVVSRITFGLYIDPLTHQENANLAVERKQKETNRKGGVARANKAKFHV